MSNFPALAITPGGAVPVDIYTQQIIRQKMAEKKQKQHRSKGSNKYGFRENEDEFDDDDADGYDRHRKRSKKGDYGGYSGGYRNSHDDDVRRPSKSGNDRYGSYGSEDQRQRDRYDDDDGYSRRSRKKGSNRNRNFQSDSDDEDEVPRRRQRNDPFSQPNNRQRANYDDDDYDDNGSKDPFAKVGGAKANLRRGDPFAQGNQQQQRQQQRRNNFNDDYDYEDDDDEYNQKQPQRRGDPFANQGNSNAGFPQRRGDPFANNNNNNNRQRGDPFANNNNNMQRGDPFGNNGGFPQAKRQQQQQQVRRRNPFGDDDDDSDDDDKNGSFGGFGKQNSNSPFSQQNVFQTQNQRRPQQQQMTADELLFGAPSQQPRNNAGFDDDLLSLDISPQNQQQSNQKTKPNPYEDFGDLVDLDLSHNRREKGKALGSLGQQQPFGNRF